MKNQSDSNSDSNEKSDFKDYSKYVIVAEKQFKAISTEVPFHNALWKFVVNNNCGRTPSSRSRSRSRSPSPDLDISVSCNYILPTNSDCHAEILFIDGKNETVKKREIFKMGTTTPRYDANSRSVVIRILEEKNKYVEKLAGQCVPDVTFVVNGVNCKANRQYLALESPVFKEMLFGEFAEQTEIKLEGIGSADDFKDFLLAVSPLRIQPNPTNVLSLLKLARQYEVSSLMQMCEKHLKFCYEIPIDNRIFVAAEYKLKSIIVHTAHVMTRESWKIMLNEHEEKLLKPEFLYLHKIMADRSIYQRIKKMKNQSDSNSAFKLTTDYSKYVIVAENEFNTPDATYDSTEVFFHNARWKIFVTRARSPMRSITLFDHAPPRLNSMSPSRSPSKSDLDTRVLCDYILPTNSDCHAEILFIDGKDEPLKKREIFKMGTTTPRYDENSTSVVIRILEEKKKFMEKLAGQCVPDVTFVVNGVKCKANRQNLAFESPVFKEMLFGEFAEQTEIKLEGIGSADDFKDFLLAVSPLRIQPNPTNVLSLLKLARQYEVSSLMQMCEKHLKFCYEIPIDNRIFVAAEYKLKSIIVHTAHVMTRESWKIMLNEHEEKLLKPEFLYLHKIMADRSIYQRIKKMKNQSDSNSAFKLTTDYSKYVIVAENEFNTPDATYDSTEVFFHNARWKIFVTRARSPMRSITLFDHAPPRLNSMSPSRSPSKSDLDTRVLCDYILPTNSDCHAEILFIDGKDEPLKKREIFKMGTTTPRYDENSTSVVIRILEEKKKFMEKLAGQCVPDVTFVVNGVKCKANRQNLAFESPVFKVMLFGKFKDAQQSEIELKDIESADDFKDFLLAVSPLRIQPNPTNVLALLKLAHKYDVSSLMRMCEEHLKFCYEISIVDRIFLADEYDLKSLKVFLKSSFAMTNENCYKMWNEHKAKLMKPECSDLLDMVMDRLIAHVMTKQCLTKMSNEIKEHLLKPECSHMLDKFMDCLK